VRFTGSDDLSLEEDEEEEEERLEEKTKRRF